MINKKKGKKRRKNLPLNKYPVLIFYIVLNKTSTKLQLTTKKFFCSDFHQAFSLKKYYVYMKRICPRNLTRTISLHLQTGIPNRPECSLKRKKKKDPTNMAARSDKLDTLRKCFVRYVCCHVPYSDKTKATGNCRLVRKGPDIYSCYKSK